MFPFSKDYLNWLLKIFTFLRIFRAFSIFENFSLHFLSCSSTSIILNGVLTRQAGIWPSVLVSLSSIETVEFSFLLLFNKIRTASHLKIGHEVQTAILLRIQVFNDATPCRWLSRSRHFEIPWCLRFWLNEISGTDRRTARRHTPEDSKPQTIVLCSFTKSRDGSEFTW